MRCFRSVTVLLLSISAAVVAQPGQSNLARPRTNISYVDAKPVIDAMKPEWLPPELGGQTPTDIERGWPAWVGRLDAEIRGRLERGDEDSIVNFLLFGTSFTKLARATKRDAGGTQPGAQEVDLVNRRIDDLVTAIASPGSNERLRFVRAVVDRRGIDPSSPAGKTETRLYLADAVARVLRETDQYDQTVEEAKRLNNPSQEFTVRSSLYRNRGLSSDTSLLPGFAIDQTLDALRARGLLGSRSVRRVGIIGPGLDFADKHDGYDFYQQQTIQPFAVIDSLVRHGLADPKDLQVTTFDLSARINDHLESARRRARAGTGYVLQLPRDSGVNWSKSLATYWEHFGDQIGKAAAPVAVPPELGSVRVHAVNVQPSFVLSIVPQDLNIVVQRLDPLQQRERLDLIVATNVLVYYSVFEQSLAFANVAAMLRPGGFLLSNNALFEVPGIPMTSIDYSDVEYTDQREGGDAVIWYQRH